MGSNGSHLTVRDNTFWNNSGYEVGSIALKNSSAFIDHNTFVSNHGNQVRASLLLVLLERAGIHFSLRTSHASSPSELAAHSNKRVARA